MSRRAGFTQDQRALLSLTVIFTVGAVVAVTAAARRVTLTVIFTVVVLNGDFHRWGTRVRGVPGYVPIRPTVKVTVKQDRATPNGESHR